MSDTDLENALLKSPVMAAIEADTSTFQYYTSGIITSSQCGGTNLDHMVLIVGTGNENGLPYYLV